MMMLVAPLLLILVARENAPVAAEQRNPQQTRSEEADAVTRGLAALEELTGTREMAAARQEIERLHRQLAVETKAAMQAKQAAEQSATDQGRLVEQERERVDAARRDLAAAREEIERLTMRVARDTQAAAQAKQAAEQILAEQSRHLDQERKKADSAAREVAAAREDFERLTTRMALDREAAKQAKDAAEQTAREQSRLVEQEREQANVLRLDLARARKELRWLRTKTTAKALPSSRTGAQAKSRRSASSGVKPAGTSSRPPDQRNQKLTFGPPRKPVVSRPESEMSAEVR
jgi:hypothetical protein